MGFIYWAYSQLLSYDVGSWVLLVAIAFCTAYFLRVPGVFLGHVIVAMVIIALDVHWIQSEMQKPDWNPNTGPDLDGIFVIGVLRRILVINTVLLPVSIVALRLRRRPIEKNTETAQ